MKITNKFINYFFFFTMSCTFFCGTSCNTSRKVEEVVGNYDRHPVIDKTLSWQDPGLSKYESISHAYSSSKDTFVITLIDKNENKSFINSEDVVVVSTLKDSLAPIFPVISSNAAFFRPELGFDFYGTKYKLSDVTSDGTKITIHKIQSNHDFQIQAIVTDQISKELGMSEIKSGMSHNLLETIQAQHKKYILIDFWLTSCAQCFENIPMLKKFDKNGVGIINLFQIEDEEMERVEKMVARFDIPGITFRSSPEVKKYFSQNGFPFYVLIDASANKILLSGHRIEEYEKYLKF